VTQTGRFKAASTMASISDIADLYYVSDAGDITRAYFGLPWEAPEAYSKHSPITFASRVTTPLLIQHGENDRRVANDWRPEVHDSDGLQMWTGSGEWIWRPLTNPATLRFNAYQDENPRGFGRLQADRDLNPHPGRRLVLAKGPARWGGKGVRGSA